MTLSAHRDNRDNSPSVSLSVNQPLFGLSFLRHVLLMGREGKGREGKKCVVDPLIYCSFKLWPTMVGVCV